MTENEYNLKLLKIAVLCDIIESEITAINPLNTLKDNVFINKLIETKIRCSNLRRYYDKLFTEKVETVGEYYDIIDLAIDKQIKVLDY